MSQCACQILMWKICKNSEQYQRLIVLLLHWPPKRWPAHDISQRKQKQHIHYKAKFSFMVILLLGQTGAYSAFALNRPKACNQITERDAPIWPAIPLSNQIINIAILRSSFSLKSNRYRGIVCINRITQSRSTQDARMQAFCISIDSARRLLTVWNWLTLRIF